MSLHAPLVIDIEGLAPSATDIRRLRHPLVGGLILFTRNWRDREQLRSLCDEVKAVRADLLILVDHEGGRVQRFRTDGFTALPPMRRLGDAWDTCVQGDASASALQALRMATACGFVLAGELRACGVDMSFAPVLDLDHGSSGVIGDRAFAQDPAVVSVLARGLVHGLLQAGMASCGKHFPGHGFARADTHKEAAVDTRARAAILAQDARPFGTLTDVLDAVMPAHVIYPEVDARPAGFSRIWLQDVLRGHFGFEGAVFSDDLGMAAARVIDGTPVHYAQAAVAALAAGCDIALVCNQSSAGNPVIDETLAGLEQALACGEWQRSAQSEARRRALLPRQPALDWDRLQTDARYRSARALIR